MGYEQRAHERSYRRVRTRNDKSRLQDALDNIGIALRVMEMQTEINDARAANESVRDIVKEMLDNDDDESLTSVSDDEESCPTCDSDSD